MAQRRVRICFRRIHITITITITVRIVVIHCHIERIATTTHHLLFELEYCIRCMVCTERYCLERLIWACVALYTRVTGFKHTHYMWTATTTRFHSYHKHTNSVWFPVKHFPFWTRMNISSRIPTNQNSTRMKVYFQWYNQHIDTAGEQVNKWRLVMLIRCIIAEANEYRTQAKRVVVIIFSPLAVSHSLAVFGVCVAAPRTTSTAIECVVCCVSCAEPAPCPCLSALCVYISCVCACA